ncbi:unnamed protein product [Somion occarium]|uniref:Uncharacterized protein n=1 Tax=Somion occarium TaxID=3059160 RepID=A0ABP1DRX7_9APHY
MAMDLGPCPYLTNEDPIRILLSVEVEHFDDNGNPCLPPTPQQPAPDPLWITPPPSGEDELKSGKAVHVAQQ